MCENETPSMEITGMKYRVLNVDEKYGVLRLARLDYLGGICPPQLLNTSIDHELFYYTSEYGMLTLLYGFVSPENLTCYGQPVKYHNGIVTTEGTETLNFNVSVKVPVAKHLRLEAKIRQSVLVEALNQGFEVKWKVRGIELCEKCIDSNGRCGFDIVSNNTVCYCPSPPFNSFTACSTNSQSSGMQFIL